MNSASDIIHR